MKKPRPEFPSWIPAHLNLETKWRLVSDERAAVREAERHIENQWFWKWPSDEKLAMPFEERLRIRNTALTAARAAARDEFRRRALAELEQVMLPEHITRIPRGTIKDFIEEIPALAGSRRRIRHYEEH